MSTGDARKFFGIYRGVVADNKDPDGHRRLKVLIPQFTDGNVSEWIWPRENGYAKAAVPPNGSGVWVQFEGGDPSYPIWVGTFGKNAEPNKYINIKPLLNSVSLSGIENTHLFTERLKNGTTEVDLTATIVALAKKVKALETDLAAVHATLATRSTSGHTHTSAG